MQVERILNRQDLAMKLYVRDGFNPKEAFDAADLFIAESERQKREPKACGPAGKGEKFERVFIDEPEPPKPACEHANITPATTIKTGYGTTITWALCRECQRTFPPGEEPAPKQEAREWWIRHFMPDYASACTFEVWPDSKEHAEIYHKDVWIKVREILP